MQETSRHSGSSTSLIGDVLGNNAGSGGYRVESENRIESHIPVCHLLVVVSMMIMMTHA